MHTYNIDSTHAIDNMISLYMHQTIFQIGMPLAGRWGRLRHREGGGKSLALSGGAEALHAFSTL